MIFSKTKPQLQLYSGKIVLGLFRKLFCDVYKQVRRECEDNENISFRSIYLVNYMRCFNDLNGRWSAQELESLIVILIASVFLVGTAIFHAIDLLRKRIDDKGKSDN